MAPIAAGAASGSPLVQQVIQQQMLIMQQQLALLAGAGAPVMAQPAAPARAAPAAPAARAESASPLSQGPIKPASQAAPAPTADEEAALAHTTYDVKKAFGAIARIHSTKNELTDRQRVRLDSFMRRYIARTQKSKDYTTEHRPHLADPRVVNGFRPLLKEMMGS